MIRAARERQEPPGLLGTPPEAVDYFAGLPQAGQQYFIVRIVEDDTETLGLLRERVISARPATGG